MEYRDLPGRLGPLNHGQHSDQTQRLQQSRLAPAGPEPDSKTRATLQGLEFVLASRPSCAAFCKLKLLRQHEEPWEGGGFGVLRLVGVHFSAGWLPSVGIRCVRPNALEGSQESQEQLPDRKPLILWDKDEKEYPKMARKKINLGFLPFPAHPVRRLQDSPASLASWAGRTCLVGHWRAWWHAPVER